MTNYVFPLAELGLLMPEIIILAMACTILLIDVFLTEQMRELTYQLTQATLIGVALLVASTYPDSTTIAMHGMYVHDAMGSVLKTFILLIVAAVFLYSRTYLSERKILRGEFYILGLFATLGMMVLVSAQSLLTIYLGLELLSLSLYALVAMNRDSGQSAESAMKYFVLGAIASGMLLYGISILYGISNSLDLSKIALFIANDTKHEAALGLALVFIVAGLAFKLGAVPFHMWIPDVYQGSPTAVTLFISTAPKLAAFAMVMRLLVEGLIGLANEWQQMLIILSVLSMAIGNLVAIAQTNIKRMLAYSTISHMGFLILGVLTAKESGYAASMFYTISYALMSLGSFGMILLLTRHNFESENLEDFKGLNERNGWYAFILLILMLSMAGIPPMLGFWAKWSVLSQVVQSGFIWLAAIAVVFSVIGAFYYLRIIKLMYFDAAIDNTPIKVNLEMRIALSINGLLILGLGLMPQGLLALCIQAISISK